MQNEHSAHEILRGMGFLGLVLCETQALKVPEAYLCANIRLQNVMPEGKRGGMHVVTIRQEMFISHCTQSAFVHHPWCTYCTTINAQLCLVMA